MIKRLLISLILTVMIANPLFAALVTLPTTYQNGSTVTASNLNGNFTAITAQVNGGLDNDNANTTSGYRFFETRASLPTNGNQGRVVFNTANNTLNFDNGSSWQTTVTPSGTPSTGYLPYYNSGWTLLAPGSQYYSLVSNGASSLPSYQQVSLTQGVTNTLPIANGGTGQTTAQAAIDALLPSQASASGKYLTSNGSASSWAVNPGLSNVIYSFSGIDGGTAAAGNPTNGTYGALSGAATLAAFGRICNTSNSTNTPITLFEPFKWVKIAGVSTLTVYARVNSNTTTCFLRLDVNSGALTANKSLTGGSVYTNETAFTLDVSSLTNGVAYPITIYGYDSTNTQSIIKVTSLTITGS